MKRLGYLLLAAILGSALTIAGTKYFFEEDVKENAKAIEKVNRTPAYGALFTKNESGEAVPLDFTEVAKKALPTVVHIQSTKSVESQNPYSRRFEEFFRNHPFEEFFDQKPRKQQGTGSGVIINPDGYIVTNDHVISEADEIKVTLSDNREFQAEVVGTDPTTDIALLKIETNDLPNLSFVNSDQVEVGEWVMAVGNPFNLNSTATVGIVSAKGRNINILKQQYAIESFIQTDAAINPGNSGGALVDLQGNIIGINTAIASPTGAYTGYGFAVPSNIVSKVVKDLMKYGTVQRGYIGVEIRDVTGELAEKENLGVTEGVYITDVMEDGAARVAGLQKGDVIISVNGEDVASAPELQGIVASKRPGDMVTVTVLRDGEEKQYEIELRNRQGESKLVTKEEASLTKSLGADLTTVSGEEADELGIEGGVRVTNIRSGKIQRYTKMKEGFVITKVDDQPVRKVEEFKEAIRDENGVLLEGVYENYPGVYYYGLGLSN